MQAHLASCASRLEGDIAARLARRPLRPREAPGEAYRGLRSEKSQEAARARGFDSRHLHERSGYVLSVDPPFGWSRALRG